MLYVVCEEQTRTLILIIVQGQCKPSAEWKLAFGLCRGAACSRSAIEERQLLHWGRALFPMQGDFCLNCTAKLQHSGEVLMLFGGLGGRWSAIGGHFSTFPSKLPIIHDNYMDGYTVIICLNLFRQYCFSLTCNYHIMSHEFCLTIQSCN